MVKVTLLLSLLMILSSCGEKKEKAEANEVYSIKIAHGNAPDEPNGISANKWAELINEKGKGRIKATVFPASQLGSQKDVMEQILLGGNVISISDAGFLMDYVKDIGILYAPYLTESYDQYFKLIDSSWFTNISKQVQEKGFEIVTAKWVYGTRHILANKPIITPNDAKGMKIRTPNMNLLVKTIEYMGAVPTPMALSEIYTGLSQGVIDGAENPIPVLYGARLYEQSKYLSLTSHVQNVSIWIGSTKYFKTLPQDIQLLLKQTGDEASAFQTEQINKADQIYLEKFKESGVKIIKSDITAFKQAVRPLYPELFSESLISTIETIIND